MTTDGDTDPWTTYSAAVQAFCDLVRRVSDLGDPWAGPGLGEWDLRGLVGHASRSLVTVTTYLAETAAAVDLAGPEDYLVAVHRVDLAAGSVVERGRAAGRALGDDPAGAVRDLADAALDACADRVDRPVPTLLGGMLVSAYLPTRTFELAVHGLDVAAATGVDAGVPDEVLASACALAARAAVRSGRGAGVLAALSGRAALPQGFSVV